MCIFNGEVNPGVRKKIIQQLKLVTGASGGAQQFPATEKELSIESTSRLSLTWQGSIVPCDKMGKEVASQIL